MVQNVALKEGDLEKYANAAFLKEKNIAIEEITNEKFEDIREAVQHASDSEVDNEYWEENEAEMKKKIRVDLEPKDNQVINPGIELQINPKLEEYLRIHSINLAPKVKMYLQAKKRGGQMSVKDQISGLGLVAFEREKFLKTIN